MYKKLIFIALMLSIMPLTSSLELMYPQNQLINISIPCSINGFPCSSNAICNITISKSDTFLVLNQGMTYNSGGNFNFNYSFSLIGTYPSKVSCYENGINGTSSFPIIITPNGTEISTAQGIIYFIFLAAAIGIFFLCLYYSIRIPWSHERDDEGYVIGVNDMRYIKIFLIVVCYLILMFSFGLLRAITANYIPEVGVSGFFEWMFWIMLSFMYPIIVCSLIFALMTFLSNKKLHKALERGIPLK